MKNIIITGPTGSIGIALIQLLLGKKYKVYAICRPNSKRIQNIPKDENIRIIKADLSELQKIRSQLPEQCDVFFHFGWDGTFGSTRNDMFLQNKNILYTLQAVELARECKCEVFIGAGSQAEYGRVEGKLNGEVPAFPENGYGIAKLCAGQMSRIKCQEYGIRHIWTRILSVYGPHDGANTMVMSTIRKLLSDEKTEFTKGEQLWDYLYSKDAAGIFYALMNKGKSGKTYCLGSGKVKPLREYIEIIRDMINSNKNLGLGELPYGEKQVMFLCADTSELIKDTGYQWEYSFEKGIAETIEWCKRETIYEKN